MGKIEGAATGRLKDKMKGGGAETGVGVATNRTGAELRRENTRRF